MTGYYQVVSDGSIYRVYGKGFDYFAECIKAEVKPLNRPFKIDLKHLQTYVRRGNWVQTNPTTI